MGVSRSTVYKYVPELLTGGDHQTIDVPAQRVELTAQTDPTEPADASHG